MKGMLIAAVVMAVISVGAYAALGSLDLTMEDRLSADTVRL